MIERAFFQLLSSIRLSEILFTAGFCEKLDKYYYDIRYEPFGTKYADLDRHDPMPHTLAALFKA
jgi:hypothetical protein